MKATDTTRILSDLIGFDTTSCDSNLALIHYIGALLDDRAIDYELTYDAQRNKANLFATLGGAEGPGVVLSGHTDVVPVAGQAWRSDPFAVRIAGGRLYGRGSCDMKGFIAICLGKIDAILAAKLKTPIHFAFSYDEEVGCVGVQELLAALAKREVQPYACIIGEPTSMGVVRAHKGMLSKRCCVRGRAAHSSLVHQGVNAVAMAAETISFISRLAQRMASDGPFDAGFTPPYTTLHAGVIHGGTVNNIIPDKCEFSFEIRNLPNHEPLALFAEVEAYVGENLLPKMHAVCPQTGFDWHTASDYPGMDTPPGDAVVGMVSALLEGGGGGQSGAAGGAGKVSYGTEGGRFQRAGVPTVICGPGSIEQAHKADEYVDLSQLAAGEKFIGDLIDSLP